jgi:hypothetical protein
MLRDRIAVGLGAVALVCLVDSAYAHVTLETQQAPVLSAYKATLRVGHGCNGAPSLKIRVRSTEGVVAVKPMSKAGWTVETVKGHYTQPLSYHDEELTEGVREIIWAGRAINQLSFLPRIVPRREQAARTGRASTVCWFGSRFGRGPAPQLLNGRADARRCGGSSEPCSGRY